MNTRIKKRKLCEWSIDWRQECKYKLDNSEILFMVPLEVWCQSFFFFCFSRQFQALEPVLELALVEYAGLELTEIAFES